MAQHHTILRSMHDLGMAAWFGGSLMGAIGLNGAAAAAESPTERLRISAIGWARWAPVQLAAVGMHGIGGVGMMITDRGRLAEQDGARLGVVVKTLLTAAAGVASVIAAVAGAEIGRRSSEGAPGVTESDASTSPRLATAQRVERVTQWVIPALTGVLLVMGAQQGEQQRDVAPPVGVLSRLLHRAS